MASFESLQAPDRPRSNCWPRREVLLMAPAETAFLTESVTLHQGWRLFVCKARLGGMCAP